MFACFPTSTSEKNERAPSQSTLFLRRTCKRRPTPKQAHVRTHRRTCTRHSFCWSATQLFMAAGSDIGGLFISCNTDREDHVNIEFVQPKKRGKQAYKLLKHAPRALKPHTQLLTQAAQTRLPFIPDA